ncbi:hypothetical protein A0J61_04554 [Choanephora cucurbitarum]|nr:hypothetical protein A0J61_04554 [Choanephora cucurbitarum]
MNCSHDITDTHGPEQSVLCSEMAMPNSVDYSVRSRRHSCSATYHINYTTLKQTSNNDSESIASSKENTLSISSALSTPSSKRTTNFWYPRTESQTEPLEPLKRGLSKKLRGLLQPHRTQIEEGGSKEQYYQDFISSLKRCQTPESADDDCSPLEILNQTHKASDTFQFNESDLAQVDSYASTVQQRGPLLTPAILSQKFLTRPYKRELFKLRALFIWVTQNIRPEYHQKRNDLILLQKQKDIMASQPPMTPHKTSNFRQRFSKMTQYDVDAAPVEEIRLDAMRILEEEAKSLTAAVHALSKCMSESADQVLQQRSCKSAFGMAHLFVEMVLAAGFDDAQVIYGYLKGYY